MVEEAYRYFSDTGLACHLLGIESPEQLARDKMRGPLFEIFIVIVVTLYPFGNGVGVIIFHSQVILPLAPPNHTSSHPSQYTPVHYTTT